MVIGVDVCLAAIVLVTLCLADIVFMTPRTDVCAICEDFQTQLKDATREEEKVKLTAAFTTLLEAAQEERDY